ETAVLAEFFMGALSLRAGNDPAVCLYWAEPRGGSGLCRAPARRPVAFSARDRPGKSLISSESAGVGRLGRGGRTFAPRHPASVEVRHDHAVPGCSPSAARKETMNPERPPAGICRRTPVPLASRPDRGSWGAVVGERKPFADPVFDRGPSDEALYTAHAVLH